MKAAAFSLALTMFGASAAPAQETATVARGMTQAAVNARDALPPDEAESATYTFDDDERMDLRLAPFFLEGASMADMDDAARARVGDLLEASLGSVGRRKADEIRNLEDEVVRLEKENDYMLYLFADVMGVRGDDQYYLSFYGDPASDTSWAYRLDGHHLSVNFTVVGDDVSPTPLFLGAQPRQVGEGGVAPAGLRVLAEEEDTARALYESLDEAQRQQATLPLEPGRGLFVGGGDRVELELPPRGIAYSALSDAQKGLLDAVLDAYLENVAPPVAARERRRIDASGRGAIHFAWAGSTESGKEMYYRLQGPTLLIEFDNTVDEADHIHTLWRDAAGDYGLDLLARHHEAAHGSTQPKE